MSFLYSNKRKEEFFWSEDKWICACVLTTNFGNFKGIATIHPEDEDVFSERTGEQIAYQRAIIKMLQYERDNIILPSLRALKHTLSIVQDGKRPGSESYAELTVIRQIRNWEYELDLVRDNIDGTREQLREYIAEKEKAAQRYRAKQNKKQEEKSNI